MDELTFSNHSSNGTTSTDEKNRKNLTVAVQFLPHAGGDKWARRAATPYLFPQLPSVENLHLRFASVRVIRGSIFSHQKSNFNNRHSTIPLQLSRTAIRRQVGAAGRHALPPILRVLR
jgi:hypothetical protein